MNCGSVLRPIGEFLIGPLADQDFIISARCDPDDSVQALLLTRSGVNGLSLNLAPDQAISQARWDPDQ